MHIAIAAIFVLTALFPSYGSAQDSVPIVCSSAEITDLQLIEFSKERQDAFHKYRNTQAVGYSTTKFNTAVTIFFYDKKPILDLQKEFLASGSEVLAAHAGAESPMSGPAQFTVAGKPIDGILGVFLWTEGEIDYGSFLWVGELSGKYVKIRTTYVRPEQDKETASAMQDATAAMRKVANQVCEPKF